MAKKTATKAAATKKPPTKSQLYASIADKTDLSKKQVGEVMDALGDEMVKSLKKNQAFTLPGVAKMVVKKKPATKARPGRNPFTGEEIMIKAKPASKTVRIRPLKNLKDSI